MNNVKENKIELICYSANSISWEKHNDKYALASGLHFVPYDLIFSEEEMHNIFNILLMGSSRLKITIEKE